jgi:hypothetical protein
MASDLSFNTAYYQIERGKNKGCPQQADSGITKLGLGPENETMSAVLQCIIWRINLAKQNACNKVTLHTSCFCKLSQIFHSSHSLILEPRKHSTKLIFLIKNLLME